MTKKNATTKKAISKKTATAKKLEIVLPFNSGNTSPFIPAHVNEFKNVNHVIEQVSIGISRKMPVLLMGETGTGKTSLVRDLAHKTNNGFRRVNHNGGTSVDDIVGKILVNKEGTYWVDGVLTQALRNGDWYVADEINASNAEILFVYHSLLDDDGYIVLPENGGEVVRPHDNFRFFATINPSVDYHGVKELNKALMSRFLAVKTDYPNPAVESLIIAERTGIDPAIAARLVSFAGEIRGAHAKEKFSYVLSTRDLIQWGTLYAIYGKYMPSAEMSVLNKVNDDDFKGIKDILTLHFAALDDGKTNTVPKKEGFAVGDRVRVVNGIHGGFDAVKGREATVVFADDSKIGLQFEDEVEGAHDCGGLTPSECGLWARKDEIELV